MHINIAIEKIVSLKELNSCVKKKNSNVCLNCIHGIGVWHKQAIGSECWDEGEKCDDQ